MKHLLLLLFAISALDTASAASTAFLNVNVVPMTSENILAGQTVVIEDGVIVAIGDVDLVPVPEGASIVDGTDRYLMPGLAEMHAHVPAIGSPELERDFALFAANGVTTVRGMLGRVAHLGLREALSESRVFGPRLVTSGPSLNGNSVSGPADAERKVRAQYSQGFDLIKIHPGLSKDEFIAIADTANELGMPFAGHVPASVGVENALAAGITTIDHLDGYLAAMMPNDADSSGGYGGFFGVLLADQVIEARINELVEATVASGTWNVPTQSLFEHRVNDIGVDELRNRPEMKYMPAATVTQWANSKQRQLNERGFDAELAARAIELRRRLILALHEAGAGLLLGSDAPQVFNVPGYSLHDELGFLVAAGLSPFEALQTGTTAVAEFLGSNAGSIEIGKEADLVLLNANPLLDIDNARRVHGVMLRGQWHSLRSVEGRLSAVLQQND